MSTDTAGSVSVQQRVVKSKEFLVLVSHDCDIESDQEPNVESLICEENDPIKARHFLERVERNSPRRFLLDPSRGLVADAKYRVILDQRVLPTLEPEAAQLSPRRRDRFLDWLAARFDRPAIPDDVYQAFYAPVLKAFDERWNTRRAVAAAFNDAVHDVPVRLIQAAQPPFQIGLLVILKEGSLDEQAWQAIDATIAMIRTSLIPDLANLDGEPELVLESELLHRQFRDSSPLSLAHESYQGDELIGAPPLRLA